MKPATKRSHSPKVFISYCRASQGSWAIELASRLRQDGVDVVIDVWNLKLGDDMYAFMERMVTDRSVSKVLIICDKEYRNRSNKRRSGVGVEAQIISPALYGRVSQSQFIPILREFSGGRPIVPAYLSNRYGLDFSNETAYDSHYPVLLDLLHGVEADLPPLGRPRSKQKPVAVTSTIGSGMLGLRFEDPDAVDPDQTLKQAQRLIQEDPSPHGYGLAGMVLAAAGLHRTAARYLLRSVQEDEDQPSTWFNLGQAYELIGETEKASEALIRALRLRRDFSKILKQRDNELPERVKEYLSGIEERYRSLLEQRSSLMEKAIVDLKGSTVKSESALITVTKYEVARGTNLSQFIIHLEPDGTAITFCYPEELRDAEILMPFRIPKGVDFEEQKSRFMDHFGYKEFEFNEESDKSPKSMMFFAGQLKYEKLSAAYLLRWILRSVLFQEAGEAFFENRPYWEVQIDEDKAVDSRA